jgi:adenosine deaminase
MKTLENFIIQMPKVELHVHLEGAVQPETLLKLAQRHHINLPADTLEGLRAWYQFQNFDHFLEIYMTISSCLRSPDDMELITREFLIGQAEQNIHYSEVTFTAHNQFVNNQLGFHEQLDAINRARGWGEQELGVRMGLIMDISRHQPPDQGLLVADWLIERYGDGLIAFGLGGPEIGHSPEKFRATFERLQEAGIPCILHAGETEGPTSIWSALNVANSQRIGHGVRAIEDPALIAYLHQTQIPLEVCPTSNICLKVFDSYQEHCLPELMAAGLYVTINSDDPPMFNTTLTDEFLLGVKHYGWERPIVEKLVLNAVDASLLSESARQQMHQEFLALFKTL